MWGTDPCLLDYTLVEFSLIVTCGQDLRLWLVSNRWNMAKVTGDHPGNSYLTLQGEDEEMPFQWLCHILWQRWWDIIPMIIVHDVRLCFTRTLTLLPLSLSSLALKNATSYEPFSSKEMNSANNPVSFELDVSRAEPPMRMQPTLTAVQSRPN